MGSFRSFSCLLFVFALLVSACTAKRTSGDACRASSADLVCTDANSAGTCRGFTWHVDPCRGPGGCSSGVCDQTVAKADDPCATDGMKACSTDGTQLLHCQNGTMVVDRMCRGEHGCSRASPSAPPTCDGGRAHIGDPCTSIGSRCSADGKSVLSCSPETHHMILERTCLGAKGCFRDAHSHLAPGWDFLSCDVSQGEAGQPCFGYAGVGQQLNLATATCSTDGKELLVCSSGTLVHRFSCNCAVRWSADSTWYGVGCTDAPPAGQVRIANYIGRSGTIRLLADQPTSTDGH